MSLLTKFRRNGYSFLITYCNPFNNNIPAKKTFRGSIQQTPPSNCCPLHCDGSLWGKMKPAAFLCTLCSLLNVSFRSLAAPLAGAIGATIYRSTKTTARWKDRRRGSGLREGREIRYLTSCSCEHAKHTRANHDPQKWHVAFAYWKTKPHITLSRPLRSQGKQPSVSVFQTSAMT